MSNKEKSISVIINCLNGEKFIKEAVYSVLNQTHRKLEVIVWDNQSTDGTAKVVQNISSEKVNYYYSPRKTHLGDARNLAISKANYEWIAYLDCDDLWHESKLESQFKLLDQYDKPEEIGLIYGKMVIRSMDGIRIPYKWDESELPEGWIFEKLLKENFIPLLAAVFRKKAYLQTGGIPRFYKACEDYYLFLNICSNWKALALQEVCCTYRWHDSNLSHKYRERTLWENQLIQLKWDPTYSFLNFISESLSLLNKKINRSLFPLERSLRRNRKGRSVLIWGAGEKGKKCLKYLRNKNIFVDGFVDKSLEKQESLMLDKPVLHPEMICAKKHLIAISSIYSSEIEHELKDHGFRHKTDFVHDNLV
jgi:glycosyltransferase involved in cell wall biosynthesis